VKNTHNNRKRYWVCGFLVLMILLGCANGQVRYWHRVPIVAILDFSGESHLFSNQDVKRVLSYAIASKGLEVVDREFLDQTVSNVGEEPGKMPNVGLYSKIGRMVGADFVVSGRIVRANSHLSSGALIPFSMYLSRAYIEVEVTLFLIDVGREEIVLSKPFQKKKKMATQVQFFSFDDEHPSLYPASPQRIRMVRLALAELADRMSKDIFEIIF